jgi:hypothetical protein
VPSELFWTGLAGIASTAAAAFGQRRLERKRLDAESHRLHEQNREAERRERRIAYHRLNTAFSKLDTYATGYVPTDQGLRDTLGVYNDAMCAVDIYGAKPVLDALVQLRRLSQKVGSDAAGPLASGASLTEAFVDAWRNNRSDLLVAERTVIAAMRDDAGPLPTSTDCG